MSDTENISVLDSNALSRAMHFCALAEHCSSEVQKKLASWGVDSDAADDIMARLHSQGYVDDGRYASMFALDHVRNAHWGRKKIEFALRQKEIHATAIRAALEQIPPDDYSAALEAAARAKLRSIGSTDDTSVRNKLIAFLVQRGFTFDEINKTITNITKQ